MYINCDVELGQSRNTVARISKNIGLNVTEQQQRQGFPTTKLLKPRSMLLLKRECLHASCSRNTSIVLEDNAATSSERRQPGSR